MPFTLPPKPPRAITHPRSASRAAPLKPHLARNASEAAVDFRLPTRPSSLPKRPPSTASPSSTYDALPGAKRRRLAVDRSGFAVSAGFPGPQLFTGGADARGHVDGNISVNSAPEVDLEALVSASRGLWDRTSPDYPESDDTFPEPPPNPPTFDFPNPSNIRDVMAKFEALRNYNESFGLDMDPEVEREYREWMDVALGFLTEWVVAEADRTQAEWHRTTIVTLPPVPKKESPTKPRRLPINYQPPARSQHGFSSQFDPPVPASTSNTRQQLPNVFGNLWEEEKELRKKRRTQLNKIKKKLKGGSLSAVDWEREMKQSKIEFNEKWNAWNDKLNKYIYELCSSFVDK